MLSFYLLLSLLSGNFQRDFATRILYAFTSPIQAACPAQCDLSFIILTILGDLYELQNSSYNILNCVFTSSFMDPFLDHFIFKHL